MARFSATATPDGVRIEASERRLLVRRPVPVVAWATLPGAPGAAGRLIAAAVEDGAARRDGEGVLLPHAAAVALPGSLADALGLPPLAALSATLSYDGRVEEPKGRIRIRWYDANLRVVQATRTGAFITIASEPSRLSEPVFALAQAVDGYNATVGASPEARIAAWGPVQDALARATGREVRADEYLSSLTIYQAGAFALDVRETRNGPDFVPVLMSRAKARSTEDDAPAAEEGEEPEGELRDALADALLPPEWQKRFAEERFAAVGAREAYVLGRNVYCVVSPELKAALEVVRRMRGADVATRRAFVRNPRPALAEATGREDAGGLFVETEHYSERVLGLGLWTRPALPWLQAKAGQWLPEGFLVALGGRRFVVSEAELDGAKTAVAAARAEGEAAVVVGGAAYPIDEVEAAIEKATRIDTPGPAAEETADAPDEVVPDAPPEPVGREGLIIADNLEDVGYAVAGPPRPALIDAALPGPPLVATRPKAHQREGFDWLLAAWRAGLPGVLLADDMGLGKTFQALAFLAWARENRRAGAARLAPRQRGPVLVVAPTALLQNWIAEAERHLAPHALGERVDAFGSGLRRIKRPKDTGWTPETAIDLDVLGTADWVLTTYETLADNHRAFARIAWSIAVFDEMQKIKDPRTINTHAAKTMNADFVLGLTGTPIENRLEDLWCIMDRVAPGLLGALREFSGRYSEADPEALAALKTKLDASAPTAPAPMLRRMKEDHVEGLPPRTVRAYETPMPDDQARAYLEVVRAARAGGRDRGAMLKAIHALRGVSLHPHGADGLDPYDPASARSWAERSARLSRVLAVLREIEGRGEKAIVFVEDRAVQKAFAAGAATLFGLAAEPAIVNGETPGAKRLAIVDRFQAGSPGFDLLVLSPKAAGVGLTITAANHVLHLSRWWNPAVEDQCNDRCYRIGQDKPVTVHLPLAIHPELCEASFDVTLDRLLARKRALSRGMLAPPVAEGDVDALFGGSVDAS
ncbi:DEAD/DEAH box helicase [Salinarimonas rosea]|uniref:DEAD/DEAH box helicase n=1 Tax=Salinarimonas rosea TaxID=552063 RepID=UPI00041B7E48|nr:DEAD/DEAH box helicase [Salinarimonas rosea]